MKTAIFLSIALSILCIVSAVIIFMGRGDRMINNYRNLSEERRAQVNIVRLRIVTGAMLLFLGATIPFDILVLSERLQQIFGIITVVVLFIFLLVAKFWANMPLFYNPFRKK